MWLIEEEVLKENSFEIYVKVFVNVVIYLFNEKWDNIVNVENCNKVWVLILLSLNFEIFYYEVLCFCID